MGQTKKRNYDRYTLAYKLQAVKLANHPDVRAKDIAESLGIHPVMLYRWQMEHRNGELKENKHMRPSKPSPKRRPDRTDPIKQKEDGLVKIKPVLSSTSPYCFQPLRHVNGSSPTLTKHNLWG